MDVNALRTWGIIASSAVIAVSLYIAATAHAPAPPVLPPPAVAHAPAADALIAISVRGEGPLARAQRLAMRGRTALAAHRARAALARQTAFDGLCFAGFTRRNEIALRACGAPSDSAALLTRLRAMPAIANVDAEAQLPHDGGTGD
jgi:hypothetical protein